MGEGEAQVGAGCVVGLCFGGRVGGGGADTRESPPPPGRLSVGVGASRREHNQWFADRVLTAAACCPCCCCVLLLRAAAAAAIDLGDDLDAGTRAAIAEAGELLSSLLLLKLKLVVVGLSCPAQHTSCLCTVRRQPHLLSKVLISPLFDPLTPLEMTLLPLPSLSPPPPLPHTNTH